MYKDLTYLVIISIFLINSCTPGVVKNSSNSVDAIDSISSNSVEVYIPGDSLYFAPVPDQVIDEFHEFPLLDLKKFLLSSYHPDSLKWSFQPVKNLKIFIDEKHWILALRNKADWTGKQSVKFTVKHPKGDSAVVSFNFIVNSLPVLSDIPDQTIGPKMKFNKIKLRLFVKDKNDRYGDLRWEFIGAEKVKLSIDNKQQVTVTPLDSNWIGSDTVMFKVYDAYNSMSGDAVVFSVDPNYSTYNMQPNLFLRSAGSLRKLPTGDQQLINNVHINYNELGVKCDTAIVNQTRTEARLFGNVLVWDTVRTISSQRAELFKEDKKNRAFFYNDVKIDQDSIKIYGKSATFQQGFNSATVEENVKVEYSTYPAILKCRNLNYDVKAKNIFASIVDSVTSTDSLYRYRLFTSSLNYNDSAQILKLNNRFTLKAKKLAQEVTNFTQLKKSNFIELFNLPEINSPDGFTLSANKGEYNIKAEKAWLWDKCTMTAIENNGLDTTRLFADTAYYDLTARRLDLFGNVKIIKDTLSTHSQKAVFFQDERIAKLRIKPEMFFGSSYMKGDSVDIFFNKDSTTRYPEKAVIQGSGYLENPAKTALASEKNTLNGQQIELFFKKNKLNLVKAFGQVTSLFYNLDKKKNQNRSDSTAINQPEPLREADGANQVTGDTLFVNLIDNKISTIHFKGGCEGTYYPKKFKKQIKKQSAKTE